MNALLIFKIINNKQIISPKRGCDNDFELMLLQKLLFSNCQRTEVNKQTYLSGPYPGKPRRETLAALCLDNQLYTKTDLDTVNLITSEKILKVKYENINKGKSSALVFGGVDSGS